MWSFHGRWEEVIMSGRVVSREDSVADGGNPDKYASESK